MSDPVEKTEDFLMLLLLLGIIGVIIYVVFQFKDFSKFSGLNTAPSGSGPDVTIAAVKTEGKAIMAALPSNMPVNISTGGAPLILSNIISEISRSWDNLIGKKSSAVSSVKAVGPDYDLSESYKFDDDPEIADYIKTAILPKGSA